MNMYIVKMTLHNRIKQAIEESPYKAAEVARKLGVSRASVSLWMNGGTKKVDADNLIALCDLLGINIKWLQNGKGEKFSTAGTVGMTVDEPLANYSIDELGNDKIMLTAPVPLISWVQAGQFCESHDLLAAGDAEEWLPRPKGASDSTYALTVRGDSMTSPYPGSRSYPEGMIIFVDPEKEVLPGNRGIFKLPESNEVTFKELVSDAGRLYLKPLNPQYDKIAVDKEMTICGKVIGSYLPE